MVLENSQKIRKLLKSDNLRKIIKKVDDEKSALKFKTLNQIMKEDPKINEFIEAMLSEIGFADGDGRFKSNE